MLELRQAKPMGADYEAAISRHRIDLALLDGRLAGLIETIREPDHLLIENVAVDPAFQGRGVGRALMAHAEGLAREQSLGELRLYTNQKFASNIALYLRLGYRIDQEEVLPVGVAVHMSKPVT
jgi:GNAT superfamily N-acetyltransferase